MNKEEKGALEATAQDGQYVSAMIHGEGWQKVVKPALLNRELSLLGNFANADSYEEFVKIQQAVNAIRNLLSFIEVTIAHGKDAFEALSKES